MDEAGNQYGGHSRMPGKDIHISAMGSSVSETQEKANQAAALVNEAARKLREASSLMKEGLRDLPGPDDLCVVCQVPRALFPMLFLADIERIPTNRTTPEAAPVPSELASRLLNTHLESIREKYRKLVL